MVYTLYLSSASALKEQQKDVAKFQAELTNIHSVLKMNLFFLIHHMKIELRIECENLPTKTEIITQTSNILFIRIR